MAASFEISNLSAWYGNRLATGERRPKQRPAPRSDWLTGVQYVSMTAERARGASIAARRRATRCAVRRHRRGQDHDRTAD